MPEIKCPKCGGLARWCAIVREYGEVYVPGGYGYFCFDCRMEIPTEEAQDACKGVFDEILEAIDQMVSWFKDCMDEIVDAFQRVFSKIKDAPTLYPVDTSPPWRGVRNKKDLYKGPKPRNRVVNYQTHGRTRIRNTC